MAIRTNTLTDGSVVVELDSDDDWNSFASENFDALSDGYGSIANAKSPWGPMIRTGADAYRRERDLPKLLASYPADTESIVRMLHARYTAQAMLGVTRHWSYDLNKHLALASALRAEKATLAHELNLSGLASMLKAMELRRTG